MVVSAFLALLIASEACDWSKTNFTVGHKQFFCCTPNNLSYAYDASITFKSEVADSYSFYFNTAGGCNDQSQMGGGVVHKFSDKLEHKLQFNFNRSYVYYTLYAGFECHNSIEDCTMQIESLAIGGPNDGKASTWSS